MRANKLVDKVYTTLKKDSTDEKVSEQERKNRLATCMTCSLEAGQKKVTGIKAKQGERGLTKTGNCKMCGCFVKLKTEYKDENCPLNKW
jgi:hypothetical protein